MATGDPAIPSALKTPAAKSGGKNNKSKQTLNKKHELSQLLFLKGNFQQFHSTCRKTSYLSCGSGVGHLFTSGSKKMYNVHSSVTEEKKVLAIEWTASISDNGDICD